MGSAEAFCGKRRSSASTHSESVSSVAYAAPPDKRELNGQYNASRVLKLAGGDEGLHWALRRRFWNQLQYDERLKPPYRAALKRKKRLEQEGLCNICKEPLPDKGAVLDRLKAMDGYTLQNTQLLCVN